MFFAVSTYQLTTTYNTWALTSSWVPEDRCRRIFLGPQNSNNRACHSGTNSSLTTCLAELLNFLKQCRCWPWPRNFAVCRILCVCAFLVSTLLSHKPLNHSSQDKIHLQEALSCKSWTGPTLKSKPRTSSLWMHPFCLPEHSHILSSYHTGHLHFRPRKKELTQSPGPWISAWTSGKLQLRPIWKTSGRARVQTIRPLWPFASSKTPIVTKTATKNEGNCRQIDEKWWEMPHGKKKTANQTCLTRA